MTALIASTAIAFVLGYVTGAVLRARRMGSLYLATLELFAVAQRQCANDRRCDQRNDPCASCHARRYIATTPAIRAIRNEHRPGTR